MSEPDFLARATDQLRHMAGDDTVVLATLNADLMHLQTRAPRGPAELVQIARRLLEEAVDDLIGIEAADAEPQAGNAERLRIAVEGALAELPDMNADTDEEG